MLWTLFFSPAHAQCDRIALMKAIEAGERAYAQMDTGGFQAAVAEVDGALACMTDLLSPVECAGVHRLHALAAFFVGDSGATQLHFLAVQETQPGYVLPERIAPEGHPLRVGFEAARQFTSARPVDLPPPEVGWLQVDGARGSAAPAGRPYIFQHVDDAGVPARTTYQPAGAPLPDYPVHVVQHAKSKPYFIGAGVGFAVVAAGTYGGAFASRARYDKAVAEGDADQIRASHTTTNALAVTALGALGAGAGMVVIGVALP